MNRKIVVPGEFLSSEEEYVAGKNTFSLDGKVYAALRGEPQFDDAQHVVGVLAGKSSKRAAVGTIVYGKVLLVKDSAVIVKVIEARKDSEKRVFAPSYASIYVAHVSTSYVKNLKDQFRIGDVVKAIVAEVTPYAVKLRTDEQAYGVVKAFCTQCRSAMQLHDGKVKCLNCGSEETRKISSEYSPQ